MIETFRTFLQVVLTLYVLCPSLYQDAQGSEVADLLSKAVQVRQKIANAVALSKGVDVCDYVCPFFFLLPYKT